MTATRTGILLALLFFSCAVVRAEHSNGGDNSNGNNNQGNNNNNGGRNQSGGGGSGGGGGGMGGGGMNLQYKPREQDKLDETKKDEAKREAEMKDNLKNYNSEVAKQTQSFMQQLEKSKIAESDALLKEIARRSANVTKLTGIGKEAVNGTIGDLGGLGKTASQIYMTQANALLSQPKVNTAKPAQPSIQQQLAGLGPSNQNGSPIASAAAAPGSGGKKGLGPIDSTLGNGQHSAKENVATSFSRGQLYNPPASRASSTWNISNQ